MSEFNLPEDDMMGSAYSQKGTSLIRKLNAKIDALQAENDRLRGILQTISDDMSPHFRINVEIAGWGKIINQALKDGQS